MGQQTVGGNSCWNSLLQRRAEQSRVNSSWGVSNVCGSLCTVSFFLSFFLLLFLSPTHFAFLSSCCFVFLFFLSWGAPASIVVGFCQSNEPSRPRRTRFQARRAALGDSNLPLSECKSMRKKSSQQQEEQQQQQQHNYPRERAESSRGESINKPKAKSCAINHRKTHECRVIMRSYFNCRIIIMLRTLWTLSQRVSRESWDTRVCKARPRSSPSLHPNPTQLARQTKQNTCRPPVSGHVCAWTGACTKKTTTTTSRKSSWQSDELAILYFMSIEGNLLHSLSSSWRCANLIFGIGFKATVIDI